MSLGEYVTRANGGGFTGNGCVRRIPFAGHVAGRHRTLLHAKDGLAGHAVENEHVAGLAHLRQRGNLFPVAHDIDQARRGRQIIIPDVVMHHLEMPLVLAGLGVDSDQRVAEQIVAVTVAAIVGRRRRAERHVDDAALLVDSRLHAPHVGAGAILPTVVLPGLVTQLRRDAARNGSPTAWRRCGRHRRASRRDCRVDCVPGQRIPA